MNSPGCRMTEYRKIQNTRRSAK